MAFDLDEDELKATRKMNKADRNDIEVGEYVRVNNDNRNCIGIGKATKLVNESVYVNMNNKHNLPVCFQINNIVKHSKQLIDLIEVKDLVCFKNKLQNSLENEEMIIHIFDNDTLEEVKQAIEKGEIELLEILTHEQFKKSSYKVGGEDER